MCQEKKEAENAPALTIGSMQRGLRSACDKFPDFFRMGTFIDSTYIKF